MIDWRLTLRGLLLVLVALAITIPILRPAISSALVTRGDALLFARDARAQEKYRLAFAIEPANLDAADRYVFVAFLSRNAAALEDGIRFATAVLRRFPDSETLRMDRALCLQLLRRYAEARADFERVGRERDDVQALALAAGDARRLNDPAGARGLLVLARRIDATYAPVRMVLARRRR